MKRLIVELAAVIAAACSGASTTAPSSTATPPPVTAATFALNGTVNATATNFFALSKGVTLTSSQTVDF